jgi:ABC-2 type transport system ATP-binding protein
VTGHIQPNQGEVRVTESDPFFDPLCKQRLGYLPEIDELPERLDGASFLRRCALLRGYDVAAAGRVAFEALSLVGLGEVGLKKTAAYSKGMRQRLKLAQAVFHGPDIIVLDEPLTGLDPVGRREMIDLIKRLGASGATVLVSSHVLYEIELMTDQVVLIVKGKILAEGTIEHIRSLIDAHPHTVDIKTAAARDLAGALLSKESVVSVDLEAVEGGLRVRTRDPDRFYDLLGRLIVDEGIEVDGFHSPDNNLQAVFDYLVK